MQDDIQIEFKLVDFHDRTGSLQVLYYNQDIPEGITFSINVPIVDGSYLKGDDLVNLIQSYAPRDMFERAAAIRTSGLESPVPGLASSSPAPEQPATIHPDRQLFVMEGTQRVLMVRPLVQVRAFGIPVEVI